MKKCLRVPVADAYAQEKFPIMAQITATTKEVEMLVKNLAGRDISGFTFLFKSGEVAIRNMSAEGDAEFSGMKFGYAVKLSKDDGATIVVTPK